MRSSSYIIISFFSLLFACHRKMSTEAPQTIDSSSTIIQAVAALSQEIPGCIQKKIDSIKQLPVWNPPAEIHEYERAGKKVYVISADCCDFFTTAVDENCNYVCAPAGGFTGRGDRKCPNFFDEAKHLRLVWKDERKKKK